MDEAIAAEDEIGGREWMGGEIALVEGAARGCVALLIGCDDSLDDVGASVEDGEFDFAQPVKIAAGDIEERLRVELTKKVDDGAANDGSLFDGGAVTGAGFFVAPEIVLIDVLKAGFEGKGEEFSGMLFEAGLGDDFGPMAAHEYQDSVGLCDAR